MASNAPEPRTWSSHLRRFVEQRGAELCACTVAVLWFHHLGYGPTLRPTSIQWMMREDWAAYFWGFAFFRNAPWSLPLGATPDLFHPFGTSIGFTDANPWVSTFFRALSPWLPLRFQFSGMWFLACFVLQALFGTRVARALTDDKLQQALGGSLFALTPLLPSRSAHIALCGFFFLTAGLWLYLAPTPSRATALRTLKITLFFVVWAAGTHGYLSLMLLALVLALCLRLWREGRLSLAESALAFCSMLAATLTTYALFGYIGWKPADLTAEGFGQFSGDLTALVNPQGWSRWVAPLPHFPRQWEGFSYLGTGIFLLLALRLVLSLAAPRQSLRALGRAWPLVVVLGLMWLYSLSSHVAYQGELVLSLEWLYADFTRLTGIFRSSGRFSWPLHLTLIATGITAAAALRWRWRWLGRALLAGALLLQALELDPSRLSFEPVPLAPLRDPVWKTVSADYRHLTLVPIHLLWVCRYDPHLVNRLSFEAYRRRLTFNSGNFMRKEAGVEALCEKGLAPDQPLDASTVYVVEPAFLPAFHARKAVCGALDGVLACVSGEKQTPLLERLRRDPA